MIFPRKAALWTAVCIGMMMIFSSCRFGRVENDFVFDLAASPVNLDPQSAGDTASRQVIANLFEGLVSTDDDGNPSPAAAESWSASEDEQVWNFQLNPEGKWSNGDPVTAENFVFAFQRLLAPATNAPFAEDFYTIENARQVHHGTLSVEELGVTALSDYVLEIRLEEPDPYLFEKLDTAAAMPCHQQFFMDTKGRYGLTQDKIMGNGAFYLSSWPEGGNLSFRPSASYYDADRVTATSLLYVVPKPERQTPVERFQEHLTSAAPFIGSEYLMLTEDGQYEALQNDGSVWGMVFNTETEPFSSENFRKALFLSADFSTMEQVLPDYLERIQTVIPPGLQIGGKSYRSLAGYPVFPALDPAEAQKAYAEALTEMDADSLRGARMILPETEGHAAYFAYLAQIWQRDLGLYITVETLPQAEYEKRLAAGDFECALYRLAGSSSRPVSVLAELDGVSFGCKDPAYGPLLEQAAAGEGDPAKLCLEAEQLLLDTCTFLPFYRQSEYFVMNSGISGVTYHFQTGIPDFRYAVTK